MTDRRINRIGQARRRRSSQTTAPQQGAASTPANLAIQPRLAFLDLEASSLNRDSFPIEIGWVFDDGSGESFLIRPEPSWVDWSSNAQALHGISMETLLDQGHPASEVADRTTLALRGCLVVSDAPGADQKWLDSLAEAANIDRIVTVRHYYEALNVAFRPLMARVAEGASGHLSADALTKDIASQIVIRAHAEEQILARPRHRALDDALSLRRIWLSVSDDVTKFLARHEAT